MEETGSRRYPEKPAKVYLFGTCLIDLFCPQAGMDAVRLLEREGIEVHFPQDQTCCGQPAHSSGFPEQTRAVALAQLRLFPEPWPVIVPSGSCAGMMRHHYPKVFADDARLLSEAQALAERIFELSEFLVQVAKVRLTDRGEPARIALHTSCAARREMGTLEHARALLGQLPAVELALQAHESECCGFRRHFFTQAPVDLVGDGRRQGRCDQGNRRAELRVGGLRLHVQPQSHPRKTRRPPAGRASGDFPVAPDE
jgi:L-lactate dehydrogenase complex protein LldE